MNGKPSKVIEYVSDITTEKMQRLGVIQDLSGAASGLESAAQQLGAVIEELVANSTQTSN